MAYAHLGRAEQKHQPLFRSEGFQDVVIQPPAGPRLETVVGHVDLPGRCGGAGAAGAAAETEMSALIHVEQSLMTLRGAAEQLRTNRPERCPTKTGAGAGGRACPSASAVAIPKAWRRGALRTPKYSDCIARRPLADCCADQ